jgi:hypothetical protein
VWMYVLDVEEQQVEGLYLWMYVLDVEQQA